jgi:ATP-dependent protease ClpP protease subunit
MGWKPRAAATGPGKLTSLTNLAEAGRRAATDHRVGVRDGRSWYTIRNAAGTNGPAEIYLYDMIGGWGITAQDFVDELRQVTGSAIDLHVNCEGGEVFDGIAIFAALAQHPATVTVYVDGLAASAASFIVQAGDDRVMGRHARMMIHDAHAICIGNAADMRDTAALLDDLSGEIASIYAERSGRADTATWRQAMTAGMDGTWYAAQAAVDAGLADRVADAVTPGDRAPVVPRNQQTPPADQPTEQDPAPEPEQDPANDLAWDPAAFLQTTTEWPALIVDPEPDPGPPAINPYELIRTVREATSQ